MQHLRGAGWVKATALPDSLKLIRNLVAKGWIERRQAQDGISYRITEKGLAAKMALVTDGIGGSPYGPGTLAGTDGSRQPVGAELTTARNLGSRLARVAGRLKDLRAGPASAP
jgi:hypothetical protein